MILATPPIPQPDAYTARSADVRPARAPHDRVAWFPATVIDEATGEAVPDMRWRCEITFTRAGKIRKACVLVGTIPLHAITDPIR